MMAKKVTNVLELKQIAEKLELELWGDEAALKRPIQGGYASDLLSCVMQHARTGTVWVTIQSHMNVVAVASLLGLAGVIITEGKRPDEETIARAAAEGVALLLTPKTTFDVVSELAALGIRGEVQLV